MGDVYGVIGTVSTQNDVSVFTLSNIITASSGSLSRRLNRIYTNAITR